jgi:hypothetical protein
VRCRTVECAPPHAPTVGCSIERFIQLNKGCALRWLVAQALEASKIEVADRIAAEVHPN